MFVRCNKGFSQKHTGPVAGGRFWALAEANDIPSVDEEMTAVEAFCNFRVWMQNAETAGGWSEIDQVPEFKKVYVDDVDGCTVCAVVLPYMPEFYMVPRWELCGACDGKGTLGINEMCCPSCGGSKFYKGDSDE